MLDYVSNDILNYTQLKMLRLRPVFKHFSLKRAVEEIVVQYKDFVDQSKVGLCSQFVAFNTREGQVKKFP